MQATLSIAKHVVLFVTLAFIFSMSFAPLAQAESGSLSSGSNRSSSLEGRSIAELEELIKTLQRLVALLMEHRTLTGSPFTSVHNNDGKHGHDEDEDEDDEDEDDEDEDNDEDNDNDNDVSGDIEKITVEFEDGEAKVKVDYTNDNRDRFTYDTEDEDEVIEMLADELDISEADVEDFIEFEN